MKKALALLLLLATLAGLFCACGNQPAETDAETEAVTETDAETVYDPESPSVIFTDPVETHHAEYQPVTSETLNRLYVVDRDCLIFEYYRNTDKNQLRLKVSDDSTEALTTDTLDISFDVYVSEKSKISIEYYKTDGTKATAEASTKLQKEWATVTVQLTDAAFTRQFDGYDFYVTFTGAELIRIHRIDFAVGVLKKTVSEMTEEEQIQMLAYCVTEGGVPTDRESIFTRFALYKDMGITCVRIDTSWSSPSKGVWTMNDTTKYYLEAADAYGLYLKLILPTVMAPPAWLSADDNTRMMDYNGRLSINTVSYWYDGILDYTHTALTAMMNVIMNCGYTHVIGAVIADMGPAGEALYPPAWTQVSNGLDSSDNGEEVMWCYGDNAQADFRTKMEEKYGTIDAANSAWGKSYASFADITVPKPGEVKGQMWRDVLTWYRDTKRVFMKGQIEMFQQTLSEFGLDVPVIVYLPGADFTDAQWEECAKNGTAISGVKLGCDNNYMVELAEECGAFLQYTGITGTQALGVLRTYMTENEFDIPVFGENAGDAVSADSPSQLYSIIREYGLAGIDYTHCRFLFESDGVTTNERFESLKTVIGLLKEYLAGKDAK